MNKFDMTLTGNGQQALNDLAAKFGGTWVDDVLLNGAQQTGALIEGFISEYPTPTGKPLAKFYVRTRKDGTTYMSKYKSAKQQFKVYSLAKEGKIPYRRKGTLGKSITSKAEKVRSRAVRIRVGSSLASAPFVIGGEGEQSNYHKGNWTPLEKNIQDNMPTIAAYFGSTVAQSARALL